MTLRYPSSTGAESLALVSLPPQVLEIIVSADAFETVRYYVSLQLDAGPNSDLRDM